MRTFIKVSMAAPLPEFLAAYVDWTVVFAGKESKQSSILAVSIVRC